MRKARQRTDNVDRPTVMIGKKGPTASMVKEISRQLDESKVVRVKVLKTALVDERVEGIAKKVAEETESRIVQLRGHTFTLYKPKRR